MPMQEVRGLLLDDGAVADYARNHEAACRMAAQRVLTAVALGCPTDITTTDGALATDVMYP
ncbi:MAG: hypothetical protein ACTTJL_00370 [Hoylesella enoeca]|uniref:hypothetical protein n=1 Tax=Hoylesella enoeca TaxID=76123 RepID=UPI003F9F7BA7